jgi:hypothetical protein
VVEMRPLIAYEERHHLYSDAVEDLLRRCRPHISVMNVPLEELKAQLERFAPHLAVCSECNTVDFWKPGGVVELSPEPAEPSEVCIDGRHRRLENPGLAELLESIDETEELVRTGRELRGC